MSERLQCTDTPTGSIPIDELHGPVRYETEHHDPGDEDRR